MSVLRAEVVVVGAGPAGSVTALLLARAGVDVLLLDRARFPREKPCGDCLSAQGTRLLARLGLLDAVLELAPARLRGWRIRGPRASGFSAAFADCAPGAPDALAVPRRELDALLLAAATRAGARVLTGARVTDLLQERGAVRGVRGHADERELEVRAALTVGADGLRSVVARRMDAIARPPRLRKLSLTAHVPVLRAADGYGEMHVGAGLCVGLAPVDARGAQWNVTVVADARRFGREAARDADAFFLRALATFPELPALAGPAGALLASGPFDAPTRAVTWDGLALVGDAAGYYDPFTGQGVYQAMAGAEALAPVAAAALEERLDSVPGAELEPYRRAQRRLTAGPRRVQRAIETVLSRPRLAALALRTIERRPPLARRLLAVTGDLLPARALLGAHALLPSQPERP